MDIRKRNVSPVKTARSRRPKVTANVFADFVGIMLRLVFGWRNVGRVIHRLEQKKAENENPNQIDKVPEQPRHLNSIREMLRILAIQFRPDRQPEINEDDHPAKRRPCSPVIVK
jgi:hypothetical protein